MNKLKQIHKAIQEILDTLPNHSNKVYLLEDYKYGMNSIHVMFDTYYDEHKTLYLDRNGVYMNGRGQNQGDKSKIYLKDFSKDVISEGDKKLIQIETDKINNKLDTRIPSKDINAGMICKEYTGDSREYYMLYVGKIERTIDYSKSRYQYQRDKGIVKDKINVYVYLYENTDVKVYESYYVDEDDIYRLKTGYFYTKKSKVRFDKIIKSIDDELLEKVRNAYENKNDDKYMSEYKWID